MDCFTKRISLILHYLDDFLVRPPFSRMPTESRYIHVNMYQPVCSIIVTLTCLSIYRKYACNLSYLASYTIILMSVLISIPILIYIIFVDFILFADYRYTNITTDTIDTDININTSLHVRCVIIFYWLVTITVAMVPACFILWHFEYNQ